MLFPFVREILKSTAPSHQPSRQPTGQSATKARVSARAIKRQTSIEVIEVCGRAVIVRRRAYQRRLSLFVKVNGAVQVTVPKQVTLTVIAQFVSDHEVWIAKTLAAHAALRALYPRKEFRHGEKFLFFGRELPLQFQPHTQKRIVFSLGEDCLVAHVPDLVWSRFNANDAHPEFFHAMLQFYAREGERWLRACVENKAQEMNLRPRAISFRSQRTRWGSCSSNGKISLNWRLAIAPREVGEYVVVHELAHLAHPNHSRAFWSLVKQHCADFESRRRWLRKHTYSGDFLARQSELHL